MESAISPLSSRQVEEIWEVEKGQASELNDSDFSDQGVGE